MSAAGEQARFSRYHSFIFINIYINGLVPLYFRIITIAGTIIFFLNYSPVPFFFFIKNNGTSHACLSACSRFYIILAKIETILAKIDFIIAINGLGFILAI